MKAKRVAVLIPLVFLVAEIATEGPILAIVALSTWIATVVVAAAIGYQSLVTQQPGGVSTQNARPGARWMNGLLLLGVFVAQVGVTLPLLAAFRELDGAVMGAANLRGIGNAISVYCDDFKVAPGNWNDLVSAQMASPGGLIAPLDGLQEGFTDGQVNSSYVGRFRPDLCSAHDRWIVAYEREAWTPLSFRAFFRRYGRWVLFRDGSVERLSQEELDLALRQDQ
ncbi:MAG: hypothetical protein AMXMBFR47_30050 [Planctomycetota bacterium]